jgi:hypothetical protein
MGLPVSSSLSVLCVEMMPGQDTYVDMVSTITDTSSSYKSTAATASIASNARQARPPAAAGNQNTFMADAATTDNSFPLSGQLGNFRILRTSPLTPVPFVCCT